MPDELKKLDVIESYDLLVDSMKIEVNIIERDGEFVREYFLNFPDFGIGTKALLSEVRKSLVSEYSFDVEKLSDAAFLEKTKSKFRERAEKVFSNKMPETESSAKNSLIVLLMQDMFGLGKIEFLLADSNLEEIVINDCHEPVWVYHKKRGWLKSNVFIETENDIENYSNIIARHVGKQITTLNPLLDAHLTSGDRANATLFPISTKGNTITIRRFRRDPWTVTDLIENKTASAELMALIWEAMEYELNIIISGGTASGKTSFLNVLMPFIQPNHRIISIEDTRELTLPQFLHWVPLATRSPNQEGKGEVSMLDLLVNSLRMRPDRLIIGEIRRQSEAEVMFEGMHTGHSVYTTFHANTADETIRRFTNPPVSIPHSMLESVHLNVVMFRNRRLGARRVLQVAEFIPEKRNIDEESIKANVLYRWRAGDDTVSKHGESIRLFDELSLHTGLSPSEINEELSVKQKILEWMVSKEIHDIRAVGKLMAEFYLYPDEIIKLAEKNLPPKSL